jgi:dCMP deaminase
MMAERSTCKRLKVGCVITSHDFRYVYGVGYNGNATGLPNTCDSDEPGRCGCVHAEENAVINCVAPREATKIVFTTDLPCVACAKRLINLGGVSIIYYNRDYRIRTSLEVLNQVNIKIQQFSQDYPV